MNSDTGNGLYASFGNGRYHVHTHDDTAKIPLNFNQTFRVQKSTNATTSSSSGFVMSSKNLG